MCTRIGTHDSTHDSPTDRAFLGASSIGTRAGHAFMEEDDDGYRADAAAVACERMLSFFRSRLG